MTNRINTKIGRRLEDVIAEREARDADFRAAGVTLGPSLAVANAVTLARIERSMTQAQLATELGTTNTAISRLESGRHVPTLETMQKLSDALGLTFNFQVAPARAVETQVAAAVPTARSPRRNEKAHLIVAHDPARGAWVLRGADRVVGVEPTQAKALEAARRTLRAGGGTLETRRATGEVREIREVRRLSEEAAH